MPGSVANATVATVLPNSLCRSFRHSREYSVETNIYLDGSTQRRARTTTSRKSWEQVKRLPYALLIALRDFYDARAGSLEPFFFYDLLDDKTAVYDATGVLTVGRYAVIFMGTWSQDWGIARGNCGISLIEVS